MLMVIGGCITMGSQVPGCIDSTLAFPPPPFPEVESVYPVVWKRDD